MAFGIDLSGHRVLITGGGQGVGLAIGHALVAAGGAVVINDIRADAAEAAAAELRGAGGDAGTAVFDVTDWEQVRDGIDRSGDIDILVNNAGNAGAGSWSLVDFVDSDPTDWQRYVAVNLFGVMHCTKAVLPSMIRRRWGRVVTIISDAARSGNAKLAPYAAAKAGAAGFCRSVAREVGRHQITVNCVSLGNIATPSTAPPPPQTPEEHAREKAFLQPYVIRRRGRPEDVAGLVTYLASPLAEWITGQTYVLNGGYSFSL